MQTWGRGYTVVVTFVAKEWPMAYTEVSTFVVRPPRRTDTGGAAEGAASYKRAQ